MTGTIIFALSLTGNKAETSLDIRNLADVDYTRLPVLFRLLQKLESSCNALLSGDSPKSLETEAGEASAGAAEEEAAAATSDSEFDI